MNMQRVIGRLAVVLWLVGLAGCQTGTRVEAVSSEKPEAATMGRVLVIGVDTTPGIQKSMEEAFSHRLGSKQRVVLRASDWFPGEQQPTRAQLTERVKAEGVTGVLVTRLLNYEVSLPRERGPEFSFSLATPSRTPGERVGWDQDPWVAGLEQAQRERNEAVVVTRQAVVETRLYDVASGQVMWQATSRTVMTDEEKPDFDGFAAAIMAQLRKSGWLR